jgi:hypothetical protein
MAKIDGIEVVGSRRFEYRTRQALELLSNSPTFLVIKSFLAAIHEAKSSELCVRRGKPTFRVGRPTWEAPLLWYASTIVHDGGHAKLYHENQWRFLWFRYTLPGAWTGKEAERICLRLQQAALEDLGAPRQMRRYVASLWENPTYHQETVRSW